MGSADLFCSVCGGPTYSRDIITNTLLLKKFLKNLNNKNYYDINPDGVWANSEHIIEYLKKNYKKLNINKMTDAEYTELMKSIKVPKEHCWQDNLILITNKDKIYKDVPSSQGEYYIEINGVKFEPGEYSNDSYLMHHDCYYMMRNKYGDITYDIMKNSTKINTGALSKIGEYHGQFFYSDMAYIEYPYLLESPLKNKKNFTRINKIKLMNKKPNKIKLMNKKLPKLRPSPSQSATQFNLGTIKTGNDKKKWIVTKNKNGVKKWTKI